MLPRSFKGISSHRCMRPTCRKKFANNYGRPGCRVSESIRRTNCIWWYRVWHLSLTAADIMELTEYVPREELEKRWVRVRQFMDCDSLLILQNVDQYYMTGTLQSGVLWFPREGEPLLAVRKSFQRAKIESAVR